MTELAFHDAFDRARRGWRGFTLARQFLRGGAVLVAGMLAIGVWVTRQIEQGVTSNTAATTALYVDSVIAPLLPDVGTSRSFRSAPAGHLTRCCRGATSGGGSSHSRSG